MNTTGSLILPYPFSLRRIVGFAGSFTSAITTVLFLVSLSPARAEEPEDQYLRIYTVIQQADNLNTKGEAGKALAKYQEAFKTLQEFQRSHPEWNAKTVSFRLNYVTDKIVGLSGGSAASAAGTPSEIKGSSTTQVKLVEAGGQPRKALRLHPKAGDKQNLEMTMKMNMDMKVGEMEPPSMKMPAIKLVMSLAVKSVAANGDIAYDTSVTDVDISDEPGVMPQIADAIKASFSGVKGMAGTGVMSNRGINKKTELKLPPDANPQMKQMMDQMKDSLANLASPLPDEPVGPGAKWEVKMPIKSQGMTIEQTATYELVSVEGDRVTAKSKIGQRAAKQKIDNPAMPGMKIDLDKMSGNGMGQFTLDLSHVLPPERTMDLHSDFSMGMDMAGQKQTMTMKMDLNLHFESKGSE